MFPLIFRFAKARTCFNSNFDCRCWPRSWRGALVWPNTIDDGSVWSRPRQQVSLPTNWLGSIPPTAASSASLRQSLSVNSICRITGAHPASISTRTTTSPPQHLTTFSNFAILQSHGAVPKRPKGEVCKTSIRGFKSHPRLHPFSFSLHQLLSRLFAPLAVKSIPTRP